MATYTVQAPDGRQITLEGPEGASQADVIAQAQRLYQSQQAPIAPIQNQSFALPQQPSFQPAYVNSEITPPGPEIRDPFHAAMISAGAVPERLGTGAKLLYHKLFGTPESVAQIESERAATQEMLSPVSEQHPVASAVGGALPYFAIPGALATTLPRTLATSGGISAVESGGDPLETALGTVMGGAGYGVGKGLGAALSGARPLQAATAWTRDLARQGRELGFRLSPATATESPALRIAERSARSSPFSAGFFQKMDESNQATANRIASRAIGEDVDQLTPDVVDSAVQRIGNQFDALTQNKNIPLDDAFLDDIARIEAIETKKWGRKDALERYIEDALEEASAGTITGQRYQQLRSALGKEANQQMTSAQGDRQIGEALFDLQEALDSAAERTMTADEMQLFSKAREQWRHLRTLTDTSIISERGDVSLLKLANKLRQKDKAGYSRGGITGTGTPTQDLYAAARWAQSFKQPGSSQTAERLSMPLAWMSVPMTGGLSIPAMALTGKSLTMRYPWETGLLGMPAGTRDVLGRTGLATGLGVGQYSGE